MKYRHGSLVLFLLLATAAPASASDVRALSRDRTAAHAALERARSLREGRGVRTGRELTPALAQLSARYAALSPDDRREADRLLARPTDGAGDPQGDGYTVPEHAPFCTASFCFHWVTSTADAPDLTDSDADDVPDYVQQMAARFELVRTAENVDMGWRAPVSDGARGGDGRLDVYLIELAGTSVLGYAATDPGQPDPHEKFAYMAMDDSLPAGTLDVTAAHEYNHVLQFAYDAAQDQWMFEATAVWMEDRVFDDVDQYVDFIPTWATQDEIPLARSFHDLSIKPYGSAVWNMWLDAKHGPVLIRTAWNGSRTTVPASFAPAAYDAALTGGGHEGFSPSFGRFSAAVAEWRTAAEFPEGAAYADAQRRGTLAVGGAVSPVMDHTTYAMYTVPQPAGGWPAVLRLDGELPAGVKGALALVGRTGADPLAGAVTTQLVQLPSGGVGSIQLADPASFGRITAVLVNADTATTGFADGDWVFSGDGTRFAASAGSSGAASEAPANAAAPAVTGTPRDGSTLTATTGGWTGSAPMAYARQWRRCGDATPESCADVAGATGQTYTATETDVGKRLRVKVTASNGAGDAAAESAPTEAVVPIAPANVTAPAIDDTTPVVGQTLNTSDGTWSGSKPQDITYQWRRCTTTGLPSCSDIALATSSAYTVVAADAGTFLRVFVTATNGAGSASRVSAATQAVQPAAAEEVAPAPVSAPVLSGGDAVGAQVDTTDGTWTGTSASFTYQWLRCADDTVPSCADIANETGRSYVLAAADAGKRVRARVKATNGAGFASALSEPSAEIVGKVAPPAITGTARDGELLTATAGQWTGSPVVTRSWRRCDGAACTDIAGATGATYRLGAADVGRRIRVREIAAGLTADSAPTAVVAPRPPVNTALPGISGEARDGAALTSSAGAWTGTFPIVLTRHWERCDAGAISCTAIPGAVGEKYTLGLADVLSHVRVVVHADNGLTADAASALAGPVAAAPTTGGGGQNPPPPPPPPPPALSATFTAPGKAKLAKALAGKLAVRANCSAACTVASRIELSRKDARKLKVAAVVARGTAKRSDAGSVTAKLRFASKAAKKLRKARKLTATLVAQARDASGALKSQRRAKLKLSR